MSAFDALMTAEKVTENLAGMTSQVAPCDVSSVYGIRRAMGIAVPLETESFVDLTTGDRLAAEMFACVLPHKHWILLVMSSSAGDGGTDGGSAQLFQYTSSGHSLIPPPR